MKGSIFVGIVVCWLSACGVAQAPLPSKDSAAGALRRKVVVNGNPIPVGKTLVKDGIAYVDVSALAEAMGASLKSDESGVTITQPEPKCEGGASGVEGERFSQQFRRDVAGIADEIESLRAVVLKKENVPLGPRFDAIDRKLKLATAHVQTDADMAVYYALAYANNSLAIAYYKQARGVPSEEAQKDQTDSMLCAMESKFALMKGVLVPGGSCSVFKRIETQGSPQPRE